MSAYRVASLLASLITLFAEPAWAFLDPPYIMPANPIVGDAISVNVHGGECDALNIGVVAPVISQQGDAVTILFTGYHETNPELCYLGIGTATYPVGSFPEGAYTLQVDRRYISFSATWIQETLGVIPFTVTGPPQPAPVSARTLDIAGLSTLALGLISLVVWRLHWRRV